MPVELVAVDQLLDDERFFEPFRRWFDPVFGRPSIPMETYLRLMFLKYRVDTYSHVVQVPPRLRGPVRRGDRLAVVAAVLSDPHRGAGAAPHHADEDHHALRSSTIALLNVELIANAGGAGLIDMTWLRADTTVVPADIKYPTDSG